MTPKDNPDNYQTTEADVINPPNDLPRQKDKVKGNVRLRWNHKMSTNISSYRIDKIANSSLRTQQTEPNPIRLTPEELRRKI